MLLCHPQRLPRIRILTQLLLAFIHITTNSPHFYNSICLAEVRPAALPAEYTDTYCPYPDWIRELNNYLQSIGQAANLSWAFTETGQSNVAVHYVTANCELICALLFLFYTNPDYSFHSEWTAHRSGTRNYQECCKVHGGAGISQQYSALNLVCT